MTAMLQMQTGISLKLAQCAAIAAALALLSTFPSGAQAQPRQMAQVFFLHDTGKGMPEAVAVARTIPGTASVLKNALIALFKGPTEEERAKGLSAYFSPETVEDYNTECQKKRDAGTLKPLGRYFIGATILHDGTAVIDFRPDAMCYLENTPGNASRVMEPIERTARQFPSVKDVQYSINGKRVGGWDA